MRGITLGCAGSATSPVATADMDALVTSLAGLEPEKVAMLAALLSSK